MNAAGTPSPPHRITWSDGVVELRDQRVLGPGVGIPARSLPGAGS